jgi:hypothetical protein
MRWPSRSSWERSVSGLERLAAGGLAERVDAFGIRGARWTATSLELPTDLAFAEYERVLWALAGARNMTAWGLGDAINFGERVYGEMYAQAVDATKLSESTLQGYAYVARRIPRSRRRPGLSFSHHAEVASLAPQERERWLDRAEAEKLSVAVLRELKHRKLPTSASSQPDCGAVLVELVATVRERLRACGYDREAVLEVSADAAVLRPFPGQELRIGGGTA